MKIAVCIPCRDQVETSFAFDLCLAVSHHIATTGDEVRLMKSQGTLICNQRQELAAEALIADADWILYLDSDMRFPKDVIARMLARNVSVVAANYSTRREPIKPTAFKTLGSDGRIFTGPDSTGLEEAFGAGMGVFMVSTAALRDVEFPWFQIGYSPDLKDFFGEDIYFCQGLRAAGHPIWIDHDLSKEVRHIGSFEFSNEHAFILRAAPSAPAQAAE